ncbi:RhoGAP-domain-containing protein [Basidiobolus meristosporus CBS 931.73]|uniref:RhoGAP-domain-containing protein n=1 Tax=Basidiobolus meristosporus CBS 931.73 TaxID=1314790 RepID=A0A1Y1YFJ9_9FUNG|nr:RhoGAP-domain-containing protein [Basidiobolus meristosporus CBS 931.73]|eukprot:ORX96728.1 RhoGAP-domain-containing protein [Basidiobolus meristosporus CBS 931.73]
MADYELEDEHCTGCGSVINEGNVITLDDQVWHVKCFRCSSCSSAFQTNSNILILNHQPVCESCSHICEVCKTPILDKAVLSGEKEGRTYHQRCFRCSSCQQPLEPNQCFLTPQGLECPKCHQTDPSSKEETTPDTDKSIAPISDEHTQPNPPVANNGTNSHPNPNPNASPNPDSDSDPTTRSPTHLNPSHFEPPTRSSSITKRPTRSHSLRTPTEQKSRHRKRQSMMPPRSYSDNRLEGPPTLPPLPFVDDKVLEENINEIIKGVREVQVGKENPTVAEESTPLSPILSDDEKPRDESSTPTGLEENGDLSTDVTSEVVSLKALNRQLVEQLEQVREDLLKEARLRQEMEEKYKSLEAERDVLLQSHEEYTNQKKEAVNMYKILSDNIEHLSVQKEEMETVIRELQLQKEGLYTELDSLSRRKQTELDSLTIPDEKKRESFLILSNGYLESMNYAEASPNPPVTSPPKLVEPLSPSFNYPLEKPSDDKLRRRSAVVNQYRDVDYANQGLTISYEENESPQMNEGEYQATPGYNHALDVPKSDGKKESKKFKWMGGSSFKSKGKPPTQPSNSGERESDPDNTPPTSNPKVKYKKSNSNSQVSNKAHTFVTHTFIRPLKCDHCGEKMWGLQNKEMRCQLCGFHSHTKCAGVAAYDCPGHIQAAKGVVNMFGNELEEQLRFEGREIPIVVELCIDAVEMRGIMLEGIYRKSGPTSQMREIQSALARAASGEGPLPNLGDPEEFSDITAVTSVVKQYFRELPIPLLTYDLYKDFMDALYIDVEEERLAQFKVILSHLPKAHYDTLKYLIMHLIRVQAYESVNLMGTKNLAVVFGPTLMRNLDPSQEFYDTARKNAVVEYLLCCAEDLFEEEYAGSGSGDVNGSPAITYDYYEPENGPVDLNPSYNTMETNYH